MQIQPSMFCLNPHYNIIVVCGRMQFSANYRYLARKLMTTNIKTNDIYIYIMLLVIEIFIFY